jgi:hypothetical protein
MERQGYGDALALGVLLTTTNGVHPVLKPNVSSAVSRTESPIPPLIIVTIAFPSMSASPSMTRFHTPTLPVLSGAKIALVPVASPAMFRL